MGGSFFLLFLALSLELNIHLSRINNKELGDVFVVKMMPSGMRKATNSCHRPSCAALLLRKTTFGLRLDGFLESVQHVWGKSDLFAERGLATLSFLVTISCIRVRSPVDKTFLLIWVPLRCCCPDLDLNLTLMCLRHSIQVSEVAAGTLTFDACWTEECEVF